MKCKYNGVTCYFPDPDELRAFERARAQDEARAQWEANRWRPDDRGPCRQQTLLSGLDCLKEQQNLFPTDGEVDA